MPGVSSAAVNLMTRDATVEYTPDNVRPEELVEAIRETGYEAELPAPGAAGLDDLERDTQAEYTALRRKAIVALIMAALAMVLSMPLMGHAHSGADPLLSWSMRVLDPPLARTMPLI
jgi:Cu+-exporting ATPase